VPDVTRILYDIEQGDPICKDFGQKQESMNKSYLHTQTPLIKSEPLSQKLCRSVWLKMESAQPIGSFKLRGIGNACATHVNRGVKQFVCSSGGNAGMAVAYCGRILSIPVSVIVPEATSARAIDMIRREGAVVTVHGCSWQEAHEHAIRSIGPDCAYIHPFDDPLIWSGHATMISEVLQQGLEPDVVVVSVGGGGLLCGVAEGLRCNGMDGVPIVAVETIGAQSLAASLDHGTHVTLDKISSIATSLGARRVADAAYKFATAGAVHSVVVSDYEAVEACLDFQTDHGVVVEPACGAALSVVYNQIEILAKYGNILVVVCGGAGVTLSQLKTWHRELPNQAFERTGDNAGRPT
jgi:L-serine/L-threonine ammonia-lyase